MYKLGKLPARKDAIKFKLSDYVTKSKLPAAPNVYGHEELVTTWGMLGNDQYGDCVWAGAGHETLLWNKEAGKTLAFTDQGILSSYSDVTGFKVDDPSTDQGTDMELAAKYRRKTGIVDSQGTRHKVAAYLDVTAKKLDELKQAVSLFSAVGIGIKFPKSAMDQFNSDEPWTVVKRSHIEGGHYVPVLGYDQEWFYIVTWGKLQKVAPEFIEKYMDEGIAYLSPDFISTTGKDIDGLDLATLTSDLNSL